MKTGIANLPLHGGKAPRWLFNRMVKLARPISEIIIDEYGSEEFLKRISNPYFFQSFGCVLGFDWHSSGLTTTTCGALKEALNSSEIGVVVAGGKGKTSRKTPEEITSLSERYNLCSEKISKLKYSSRMSAKVDNSLIQDEYQLYHHCFFINDKGKWAVVQQGMAPALNNIGNIYARRYHWFSEAEKEKFNFVIEPQTAICSSETEERIKQKSVLNLTSKQCKETHRTCLDLIKENPSRLKRYSDQSNKRNKQKAKGQKKLLDFQEYTAPIRHDIKGIDLGNFNALLSAYEYQPKDYEELVSLRGIGPKTLRSLALISNIIHGTELDWKDPAKYSYAHGGKDGIPYPVDKQLYDSSIEILKNSIKNAKLSENDRLRILKKIKRFV